jgi:hypothetical protein
MKKRSFGLRENRKEKTSALGRNEKEKLRS